MSELKKRVEKIQIGLGGEGSYGICKEINDAVKGGRKIIGCVVEKPSYSNWPRPYLLVTIDGERFKGEGI